MRLWSIHPQYLDSKGLVALWRETLLAKKVLSGETKGYTNHPQLIRFRATSDPINAINYYLSEIWKEADKRGYNFNKEKFDAACKKTKMNVTKGQLEYEFQHLLTKLKPRDPARYQSLKKIKEIETHPVFITIGGEVEEWEKI